MDLKIICPKCGTRIDVTKQLGELVDERVQKEASRLTEEELRKAKEESAEQLRKATEETAKKVRAEERVKAEKASQSMKGQLEKDNKKLQEQAAALTKTIKRKDEETEQRLKTMVEDRAKQQTEGLKAELTKSYQEKLNKKDLQNEELSKKLRDAQSKAQDLEAKLSSGSAQAQGIIAENDLVQYLHKHMPQDRCEVEKRGQGKKGTDAIVHVHKGRDRLGSIIIDDKWASDWGRDWPEKVWGDMQSHGAEFAYIAVNPSAFPDELKEAGFGLAPCRRAGVRVWVVDRSNLPLVLGILMDSVEKIIKLAEVKATYGSSSKSVKRFQDYLTQGYEIDLREKAKHMSTAVKSLNDMYKKVNSEYEKAFEALRSYWTTEKKMHQSISACFGEDTVEALPQITFTKEG